MLASAPLLVLEAVAARRVRMATVRLAGICPALTLAVVAAERMVSHPRPHRPVRAVLDLRV